MTTSSQGSSRGFSARYLSREERFHAPSDRNPVGWGFSASIGQKDSIPRTWEEKIVGYADLVVSMIGELRIDLWHDPAGAAKGEYAYLALVYQRRCGLRFPTDHPQMDYVTKFNQEMIKYCPRSMYDKFLPGIDRMVEVMEREGMSIPLLSVPVEWP